MAALEEFARNQRRQQSLNRGSGKSSGGPDHDDQKIDGPDCAGAHVARTRRNALAAV